MPPVAKELRVLNFHGIGAPGRTPEPGEADYWIGVDRFHGVLDRIATHANHEQLAITFDDGNISDLVIAAPGLQQRGLKAEFFVLTGRIGKPGSLGAEDIRELMRAGMRIGSHGVAHKDWARLLGEGTRRRTRLVEGNARGDMWTARSICSDTVRALQCRCLGGSADGGLHGCVFKRWGQHGSFCLPPAANLNSARHHRRRARGDVVRAGFCLEAVAQNRRYDNEEMGLVRLRSARQHPRWNSSGDGVGRNVGQDDGVGTDHRTCADLDRPEHAASGPEERTVTDHRPA